MTYVEKEREIRPNKGPRETPSENCTPIVVGAPLFIGGEGDTNLEEGLEISFLMSVVHCWADRGPLP
jgi:hypothetical protein